MLIIYILIGVMLFAAIAIAAIGWLASERFLRATEKWYELQLHVIDVTDETITLPRRGETAYNGTYGITWQDEYAVIGEIVASNRQTVTRHIIKATQSLSVGLFVRWNFFVYRGDPERALGLAYQDVSVPSQLGPLPAWFMPGQRATWVLLVHGFRATREEVLRILPTLVDMGFPALVMSYRNDAGAPLSPDHYFHLGDTEWRDVEAGVQYALAHGARDLVLYGWSMGACMIEAFLRRSSNADSVRAVVFDSPVLNWVKSLEAQVRNLHVPRWFAYVLIWFATWRVGIDFAALNHVRVVRKVSTPTLVFHSTADRLVPIISSDIFSQLYADFVTYSRVEVADHTLSWNIDPRAYEDALRAFLTRVSEPEAQTIGKPME